MIARARKALINRPSDREAPRAVMSGAPWGMGLVGVLFILVLFLAGPALVKYVFR